MRPRSNALLLASLALLLAGAAPTGESWPRAGWPKWAQERDLGEIVSAPGFAAHETALEDQGAFHRILYDTVVRVEADGRERVLDREVLVAHNQEGLDLAGDLAVTYAPSDEDLLLVRLRRRSPGGAWEDLPYRARPQAEGKAEGMYVDERTVSFIPEGLRAGDQVDFAFLRVSRAPKSPWDWMETDGYGSHVCDRRLVIDAPRALGLRFHARGFDPPLVDEGDDRSVLVLSARHVDPPTVEDDMPDGYDPFRTFLVSSALSFEAIGAGYGRILDAYPQDKSVSALAAEIVRGKKEPIAALSAWVRDNIRYVGLEVSSHRARPSPPGDVLNRGYGDCKDMALLLVRLLRAAGVEAWSALVRTSDLGPVDPELPVLAAFNHEVVAAREGGSLLFIDPTIKEAVPPWSGAVREGTRVLVADGVHGLVVVPRQADGVSIVESRVAAGLEPVRAGVRRLDLDVTTSYAGPILADMRRHILAGTPDGLRREAAEFFGRAIYGLALASMTHDYSAAKRSATPLVIHERMVFEGPGAGEGIVLRYLPPEIADWLDHPELAVRGAPFRLDHPRTTSVVMRLAGVPRGVGLGRAWILENRFVRLSRSSREAAAGVVETIWTARTLRDEVPRADLPGFVRAMTEAYGDAELGIREAPVAGPPPGLRIGATRAALLTLAVLVAGLAAGFLLGRRKRSGVG
ncbi:MAG: DUF3857 domain-containing protein [Deltaproteobacteria bacterium]|nr:DUF3857 domain-containing protein [Deltaproteobacteria bacterium]